MKKILIIFAFTVFLAGCMTTAGYYDYNYHRPNYPMYFSYDPLGYYTGYYTSTYLREYDYQMRSKLRNKARENARRDARHLIDRIFK